MTHRDWIGVLCWVLLFYPVWSRGCRRLRKRMRQPMVSRNAVAVGQRGILLSSLTDKADEVEADLDTWGVGPEWVQDRPYPELFDEEDL